MHIYSDSKAALKALVSSLFDPKLVRDFWKALNQQQENNEVYTSAGIHRRFRDIMAVKKQTQVDYLVVNQFVEFQSVARRYADVWARNSHSSVAQFFRTKSCKKLIKG